MIKWRRKLGGDKMSNNQVEHNYSEVYNDFMKSDENTQFSKTDVLKIIEAHKYKEIMENYEKIQAQPKKKRNILISTRQLGRKLIDGRFIFNLILSYLFYVGGLVLITSYVFPHLIEVKSVVFIIALVFTLIDKLVKPILFFFDLVSFTFHRIGLLTVSLFTVVFYILANVLNGQGARVTLGESVIAAVIVLFITFIIDTLDNKSNLKTHMVDDETLDQEDENDE
jgi:uncharacterized membrane protein YvlD (DUF360 family)